MLTIQMTAAEIAKRLLRIYNDNFPDCLDYTGSVDYCQKNLYNDFNGPADQADWYSCHAHAFLQKHHLFCITKVVFVIWF